MAHDLTLSGTANKTAQYQCLIPQLQALIEPESDLIANMGNVAAALKQAFGFYWVGFYIVRQKELVLGPFQGPVACTRIALGRGVCGTAWQKQETIIVPDVEAFPGHIACSTLSRSEIVLPLLKDNAVYAVLDVDSDQLNDFDETDAFFLKKICALLQP